MRFLRQPKTLLLCLLAVVGRLPDASAQWIQISQSADESSCYMPTIPPGGSGTAYIFAVLGGAVSNGITGAEFSILGMPPEMMVSVTPAPASNISIGNPFGNGCNIAFPSCQTGTNGKLLLYTVHLTAPPAGVPHYVLQVEGHQIPSYPNYPCPLVTKCDGPFSKVCVIGARSAPGPLLAVPSNPSPADGAPEVETTTDLAWQYTGPGFCCGLGTPFTNVYFGTTPNPPFVHRVEDVATAYDPGPLAPQTTYYWSINWSPDHDCGSRSGPIWSFTTSALVSVQPVQWQAVKALFR
jgi:hypothetical protein